METVNDILRDMRIGDIRATANTSSAVERRAFEYINDFLAGYADRIEVAHKRELEAAIAATVKAAAESASEVYEPHIQSEPVGNAAKMREALENSNGLLEELALIGEWSESAREQIKENNAALSAPARNCDLYASRSDAWVAFRKKNQQAWHEDLHLNFPDWLFAEVKGE